MTNYTADLQEQDDGSWLWRARLGEDGLLIGLGEADSRMAAIEAAQAKADEHRAELAAVPTWETVRLP